MINQDKPSVGIPQTELNIGSGFNLLIGGVYKLIIGALGSGGLTNEAKVSSGETWGTILTTWGTETQTWQGVSQLIDNTTKPSSSMTNFAKP